MTNPFLRVPSLLLLLTTAALPFPGSGGEAVQHLDIPPGGFAWAALTGDSLPILATVFTMAPGPWMTTDPLPLDDLRRLAGAGESEEAVVRWLADLPGLRMRLHDVMHRPVDAGTDPCPAFADVDGDGATDLVIRDAEGEVRAYLRPGWREVGCGSWPEPTLTGADLNGDGLPETVRSAGEGALLFEGEGLPFDTLSGFGFRECSGAALGDMEGDGLADLVVGLPDGRLLVYRNRGTASEPVFLRWSTASRRLLPAPPGTFSVPASGVRGDSVALAVGTARNGLLVYRMRGTGSASSGDWVRTDALLPEARNVSPAILDADSGELLAAVRNGEILRLTPGSGGWSTDTLAAIPGTYPVIAPYDAGGDSLPDLVAGTREGTVHLLRGSAEGGFLAPEPLGGFPSVPCGAPAPWGGGILMGSREGTLRLFLPGPGGTWCDATAGSVFEGIFVGEYSVPAFTDLDQDGIQELVLGSADGRLSCFRLDPEGRDGGPVYRETGSWGFEPNSAVAGLDRYYSRYFPEYAELMTPSDSSIAAVCLREILSAPPAQRDEVAMAIARTPTEVLRAMVLEGDADLFRENARLVCEAADALPYAMLRDTTDAAGGPVTDLFLRTEAGWRRVDRGDYYRFVVAPRVLFEIPARVDASFWLAPRDTVRTPLEAWLGEEPEDLYADGGEHLFWRESIPADTTNGPSLLSSAARAATLEEAVLRLCNWQSHSQPTGVMEFGYLTDDLQPLVIYRKAYGSCGEQSILQTAMCRALLIPARVVGCRGEDHQWNEFLDPATGRWTHWDVNYGSPEISHIWVSGEGVDHTGKTISTITAFGPEGAVWETTGSTLAVPGSGYMPGDSGYTPTARVALTVSDAAGRPVEGAMVLARSHWERRNMVSTVGYTDLSGRCDLQLGFEPFGGYTIDVVTPFGSAGYSGFAVEEGCSYSASLTVPGAGPAPQAIELPPDPPSPGSSGILADTLLLRPVSYYTGRLYSLDSPSDASGEGYRGARWAPGPSTPSDLGAVFLDGRNFHAYLRGESCRAVRSRFVPAPGDTCYMVLDNRSSLFTWREVTLETGSVLPVPPVLPGTDVDWLTGSPDPRDPAWSLPQPSRPPEADPPATGAWTAFFPGLRLFQDEASDPLSAGWVLGPFVTGEDARSLTVSSTGITDGLDMDLYLFADRNGNRLVDGMDEQLALSASPTASEEITLHDPSPGTVYWAYLLGWSAPDSGGVLDLGLDFSPRVLRIRALSPSGPVDTPPGEFTFRLDPSLAEGERLVAAFGQREVAPISADGIWSFSRPSGAPPATCPEVLLLDASGGVIERAVWSLLVDSLPPVPSETRWLADGAAMRLELSVRVTDAGTGVSGVSVLAEGIPPLALARGGEDLWTGEIDLLPLAGTTPVLRLTAEDAAGNVATWDSLLAAVPERPAVLFHAVSPVGVTFDARPLIQVYPEPSWSGDWTATARLEHADAGMVVVPPILVSGPDAAQFRPAVPLEYGDWTATVTVEGGDPGRAASLTWEFSVAGMGTTAE